MSQPQLQGVFLGLTITSTWGNGHATTYRALLKEFARLGHRITFLERDVPWYASNREFERLPYCQIGLYSSLEQLRDQYQQTIGEADFVVVGSYVPDGIAVGEWITRSAAGLKAFYDIDTPVTLTNLGAGKCEYLSRQLIRKYDLYLSFTGGPTLTYLEEQLQSPCARPLYCSVDPTLYYPEPQQSNWDLAYLGTYAEDRQPVLQKLLLDVASLNQDKRFAVAGPQYPGDIEWPTNVSRIDHVPASDHREWYNSQSFTLNLTRRDMVRSGFSPSVRLFEAAACGVPIITDTWPGLDSIFRIGSEILPVRTAGEVTLNLQLPLETRHQIAERARRRTLEFHTAAVRARELETHLVSSVQRIAHARSLGRGSHHCSKTAALI